MFTCDVRALAQTDALRATETGRWTRSAEPAQNRKEGPTDTRDPRDARGGPTVLRMRAAGRRAHAGEGGPRGGDPPRPSPLRGRAGSMVSCSLFC